MRRSSVAYVVGILCGTTCSAAAWAAGANDRDLDEVVITATPYGAGRSMEQVAGVVQSATAADLEQSNATDVSSFLVRRFGSVYANEIQGNPLQPDVNYRGYTASPLLGTPQGISVYADGVRLNQPFGDVVSWDLIPRAAIADVALLSGANPLYGYNSLGGALSLRTKDGRTAPGTVLNGNYGSNGRWQIEGETGGKSGSVDWYLTANQFEEDGWRDFSPSEATQAFGSFGWSNEASRVVLSLAIADTDLTGNGLQDVRLLAQDYESVFTLPDNTKNKSVLTNLRANHDLGGGWGISGNAWYRNIDTSTYNGDSNEDAMGENIYQPSPAERAALAAAGYTGYPTSGETQANTPFPFWRCIANGLLNSEPNEKCNGLINRTSTSQHNYGAAVQVQFEGMWAGRSNQFTAGAVLDYAQQHFSQSSQFGYINPDHSITGIEGPGAYADGTQDSENAFDSRVDLSGDTDTQSVFLADTLALSETLTLSAGLRYDHSRIRNTDLITPEGETGSLTATHKFDHVNPGVGVVWKAASAVSLYASANQASRAPSSIELGCADPESPCRLPNSMAGDPPLDQVVTQTVEAGFRGTASPALQWSVGAFSADSKDDILFVSDDQAGFGYFRNFGKTRRQGIELSAQGTAGAFSYGVHYTLLDATFRSEEELEGEANSSNDGPAPGFEGDIEIESGDRLPLVPKHVFKSFVQWQVVKQLSLGLEFNFVGESTARGNENGEHEPDNVYYFGNGGTGGYGIWNFSAQWQPLPSLTAYVQVNNLTDHQYSTSSQLGATPFTTSGTYVARPFAAPVIDGERPLLHATFVSPGTPRTYLVGLRYRFGAQ